MSKWGMYPHLEGALISKRSWALMSKNGHKGGPDMTTEPAFNHQHSFDRDETFDGPCAGSASAI